MKELVFNIKNIFSKEPNEGCLGQYEAEKYHIPAYQRGFKWASEKSTDAIQVLMNDLWDAFESSKSSNRKEYYMQYITVKKITEKEHLEVIDGQQRLTSFSILLSVLHLLLEDNTNLVKEKLEYAIREDFFDKYIYDKEKLKSFLKQEWEKTSGISMDGKEINSQDVFYLHSAVKFIHKFCENKIVKNDTLEEVIKESSELKDFKDFILDYVKIIVNEIEPHIDSERVFRNLNSNKVGLTEAELIKGLLLTKAARVNTKQIKQKHFREILEIRSSLGRQWDEIATWVNDEKVKHFFFSIKNKSVSEKGFNSIINKEFSNANETVNDEKALLLLLLSMTFNKDTEIKDSQFLLFNYFHKKIKEKNSSLELLIKLKEIYSILRDRYYDDKVYNLIGYLFFVERSKVNKINYLNEILFLSKNTVTEKLKKDRNNLLPTDIDILKYGNEYNTKIHRVLLAINVFESSKDKNEIRFDFYNFRKNNRWSLEHIFPQSPEGLWRGVVHILTEKEKQELLKMIGEEYENIEEVKSVLSKEERTDAEKDVYYNALQKTWVNNIGNMSLLSLPDNSSNGCAMFKLKRENVNEMIKRGNFVPKHTFEVFNKISLKSDSLSNWSNEDSIRNLEYIKNSVTKLKTLS